MLELPGFVLAGSDCRGPLLDDDDDGFGVLGTFGGGSEYRGRAGRGVVVAED